jgi:hypothetical protein
MPRTTDLLRRHWSGGLSDARESERQKVHLTMPAREELKVAPVTCGSGARLAAFRELRLQLTGAAVCV